jgi:hypothetical protein
MLTKTMIIEISTNVKYLNCHCFKIALEDKSDHILVTYYMFKEDPKSTYYLAT